MIQINAAQRLSAAVLGKTPAAILKFFTTKYKAQKSAAYNPKGASHKKSQVFVPKKDVTTQVEADLKADGWAKTANTSGSGHHWKKGDLSANVAYHPDQKGTFISITAPGAVRPASGPLYD